MSLIGFRAYLTVRQEELLGKEAKEKNIRLTELVKRILDEYIDKK